MTTWFPSRKLPGAGSFVQRDVEALARSYDVEVFHLAAPEIDDGRRDFRHAGVKVRRIPIDVRTPVGLATVTRRLPAMLGRSDLVHTMAAPALLSFIVRRPTMPWVHTEHWSGVPRLARRRGPVGRGLRLAARRALSGPGEVVAVSDPLAQAVRSFRRGPVSVIPNIVDPLPLFQRQRPEGPPIRLITVANVSGNKGWHLAADAVEILRQHGRNAELLWLGDGPEIDQLRQRPHVRAPGRVARDEIGRQFADADVFVLPTEIETFSLVTVEALAAGLPVVVTGKGPHRSFVDASSGEVVARTAVEIAAAAERVIGLNREEIREHGMGLAARFDEANFLRSYREVYERVTR